PNIMTEYILLFRKPGQRRLWEGRSRKERASHRIALDSVTKKEVANNIWHVAPVPPKQIAHPCPFPEEIPYRLIRWFSWKNDLVLDPFCGSGTTLKVAANLGRRWVGYELVSKYAVLAAERVRERLALRKQLVVAYDKVSYGRGIAAKSGKRARFRRKGKAGRKRAVSQPDLPLFAHEGS
ncbi:site-specific DNA-methyltransferase, partial [Candidatus Sumerlaeota bacterium]|nr:site-specific DNA-methyltransferase [Candidatus Sumerlaeota bacterium]